MSETSPGRETIPQVSAMQDARPLSFRRRVVFTVTVVVVALLLVLFIISTANVLLLAFISVLLAILIRVPTNWLRDRTPLSDKVALAVVVLAIIGLLALTFFLIGRVAVDQLADLREQLPSAVDQIRISLDGSDIGQSILEQIPQPDALNTMIANGDFDLLGRVTSLFSNTLEVITTTIIILFVALYFAIEPRIYVKNALRLVPKTRRDRAKEVNDEVSHALWLWLVSRLISVVTDGALTTVGLLLLNVPFALALGVIAGLLSFIPTFGPILSVIPAALIGLTQSPQQALSVIILYIIVQQIDNYLITPYVERQTVLLPPGLVIVAQLLMAVLVGFIGFALAPPLVAAAIVVVRMLYVEDTLDDRVQETES